MFHECTWECVFQAPSDIYLPVAKMAKHQQRCETEPEIKFNLHNHSLAGDPDCIWHKTIRPQYTRSQQHHCGDKRRIKILPLPRQLALVSRRGVPPGLGVALGSTRVWKLDHSCSMSVDPFPDPEVDINESVQNLPPILGTLCVSFCWGPDLAIQCKLPLKTFFFFRLASSFALLGPEVSELWPASWSSGC